MPGHMILHRLHITNMIRDAITDHLHILTTDVNGQASISFSPPLEAEPGVVPSIQGGTANQSVVVESATINGVTVRVVERGSVEVLGVGAVPSFSTTNVEGAKVAIWVA